MKIAIAGFKGMRPIVAAHLLDDNEAQLALNVDPDSTTATPLFKPPVEQALGVAGLSGFFKWEANSDEYWPTFTAPVDAVESPVVDDEYERMIFSGLSEPRFFANDTISVPFDPAADAIKLGVPAPAAALSASGYSTGSGYRAWVYTFVNRYGEEGPPSPLLEVSNYASGNVTLSGFSAAAAGRAIEFIRLYRTNSSAADVSEFQVVFSADIKIYSAAATYNNGDLVVYGGNLFKCVQNNTTGVTPVGSHAAWDDWYDGISDANLQPDVLASMDWEPPPAGLQGLVMLPGGWLAGFAGKVIYQSEPGYGHAWPQGTYADDFRVPLGQAIVGIAVQGSSIVAMTTGPTYIVAGSQPDQMSPRKLDGYYPCVSKRGIAAATRGTLYPGAAGLIRVTDDGLTNVLANILSEQQWQAYSPSTMIGAFYGERYIGFYGSVAGLLIDFDKGFFEISQDADAAHIAADDGTLYILSSDDFDPNNPPSPAPQAIRRWQPDGANFFYMIWRSKRFLSPAAVNFGAARVKLDDEAAEEIAEAIAASEEAADFNAALFAAGTVNGGIGGAGLNVYGLNGDALMTLADLSTGNTAVFTFFADRAQKVRRTITGDRGFTLKGGYRAVSCEMQVEGYIPVLTVEVASGMEELYSESA